MGENLVPLFRSAVANGLIAVQSYLDSYKDFHVDFYTQADVTDFCNVAIVNGPRGKIQQVFAYTPGTDCKKFYYEPRTTQFIQCWIDRSRCATCPPSNPPYINLYTAPYCNVPALGTDACNLPYAQNPEDDRSFKCQERWYAVGPDYRLYLAPRFLCQHRLCVQWAGIKRSWRDSDGVMDDQDLKSAVAKYAEAELAQKDNELARFHELMGNAAPVPGTFRGLLRDMRYRFQKERRIGDIRDCTTLIDSLLPLVDLSPQTVDTSFPYVSCGNIGTTTVSESTFGQILTYVSDPNAEGVVPANVNEPAIAYQENGSGSSLTWNTSTHVWQ